MLIGLRRLARPGYPAILRDRRAKLLQGQLQIVVLLLTKLSELLFRLHGSLSYELVNEELFTYRGGRVLGGATRRLRYGQNEQG
jgi:hypothetical protein